VRASFRTSEALLLDRNGRILHELRTDKSRRRLDWTALEQISPALPQAVILAEDKRFFEHDGVDLYALGGALLRGLATGRFRGASTISMQLAALIDPALRPQGARRSLLQKWRQVRAAWELERGWGKRLILEAYLNLASFRGEFQGVAAASRGLFGKLPHGLGAAEAALLAALIRAPNASAADAGSRAMAINRSAGSPAAESDIAAIAGKLESERLFLRPRAELAPHAARLLIGANPARAELSCTLDRDIQVFASERLVHHLAPLRARHVNEGAVLVVENRTGDVLAYVTHTLNPARSGFVDGVTARRQAGSTLKPFLYALAFDRRVLTAASRLEDSPLDLTVSGGIYQPGNYIDAFTGLITARTALAASMNVPAVRVLGLVGLEPFLRVLRELGIGELQESGDFYGPSLALGTADVTLWEMVNAYRSLANGGLAGELRLVRAGGETPGRRRVFSEGAAFIVSDILADREARSPTFGLENPLATRFRSSVKTGTSKDMRDNWCIGFSRRFTVGVWVGNFSGEAMWDISGLTGAAPVWLEIMNRLHSEGAAGEDNPPAGLLQCAARVGSGPRSLRDEWFLPGTEPIGAEPVLRQGRPRIVYPPDGAVLAMDPDIPSGAERVFFTASGDPTALRWFLNGRGLNRADWTLEPGKHRLEIRDARDSVIDAVGFSVRGLRRPN
jgi:penicillin-binding protein 1C